MLGKLIIGPQTAVCADPHYSNSDIPDATAHIYLLFFLSVSLSVYLTLLLSLLRRLDTWSFLCFLRHVQGTVL